MPAAIGKWGDCVGEPSAKGLIGAGYTGLWMYAGTPGHSKSITPGRVAIAKQLRDGGGLIYELSASDFTTGYSGGVAHANVCMQDGLANGALESWPIAATVDQHLASQQVAPAVAYQHGFYDTCKRAGWQGPVVGYGFSEDIKALYAEQNVCIDLPWQAGLLRDLVKVLGWYQDDTGFDTVDGVQVDRDFYYGGLNMSDFDTEVVVKDINGNPLTPTPVSYGFMLENLYTKQFWAGGTPPWDGPSVYELLKTTSAKLDTLTTVVGNIAAHPDVTPDQVKQWIDDAVAQHVQITGTVQIASTPVVPPAS